jgi:ornithine decarboxylase
MTTAVAIPASEAICSSEATIESIKTVTPPVGIPRDVMSKFDVQEVNNATIEDLLRQKITEDTFDKEEAFYVVDLGAVVTQYQQWTTLLPRVKPFYAIKCNNNTAIVRTLASLGVNFDCASKSEIQQILGC